MVPQWPVGGWHPGEPMSSGLWPLGTLGTDPRSMQPLGGLDPLCGVHGTRGAEGAAEGRRVGRICNLSGVTANLGAGW